MNDTANDETTTPTRAERRAAHLDDPRLEWSRTTTVRRRLVVTAAALLAAGGALLALIYALPVGRVAATVMVVALVVVLVAQTIAFGTIKASTRGLDELGDGQLDERQLQVQGLVYRQAYRIGAGLLQMLLIAGLLWVVIADSFPPAAFTVPAAVLTLQLTLFLPTLVAAWHRRS